VSADLLRQNQALREALATLADEINQCLQIIITNAGNWPIADELYWRNPGEREEAVECQANIEAAVERAKKATWSALAQPPESAEVAPFISAAAIRLSEARWWMNHYPPDIQDIFGGIAAARIAALERAAPEQHQESAE
jgi:hypothetical protein